MHHGHVFAQGQVVTTLLLRTEYKSVVIVGIIGTYVAETDTKMSTRKRSASCVSRNATLPPSQPPSKRRTSRQGRPSRAGSEEEPKLLTEGDIP